MATILCVGPRSELNNYEARLGGHHSDQRRDHHNRHMNDRSMKGAKLGADLAKLAVDLIEASIDAFREIVQA